MYLYLRRESSEYINTENIWILYLLWIGLINRVVDGMSSEKSNKRDAVSTQAAKKIQADLKHYIVEKKNYLNPKLNILEVAEAIGYPVYAVSWVLNSCMDITFSDFVNEKRIEEAKRLMDEGRLETETILGIAFDAGFNSKSSFNRLFKLKTGITPSRYAAGKTCG